MVIIITLSSWCFWLVNQIILYKMPQCPPKYWYTWLAVDSVTKIVVFPVSHATQWRKLSSVPHKRTFVTDTEGILSNALVWFVSRNPLCHGSWAFSFKARRKKNCRLPLSPLHSALWVFTSLPHCQCRLEHLLRHSFSQCALWCFIALPHC